MIESVGWNDTAATTRLVSGRAADKLATTINKKNEQIEQQVDQLRSIDLKVKAHEQAHSAAGGPYAGGIHLTYTRGPDGNDYAVAGDVPIDVSPEADPDATIQKMETVKRAALAPADPSGQDRAVAQQAVAVESQARTQKLKQNAAASPTARAAAAYGSAAAIGTASSTISVSA